MKLAVRKPSVQENVKLKEVYPAPCKGNLARFRFISVLTTSKFEFYCHVTFQTFEKNNFCSDFFLTIRIIVVSQDKSALWWQAVLWTIIKSKFNLS
jgi:hypothetical protein